MEHLTINSNTNMSNMKTSDETVHECNMEEYEEKRKKRKIVKQFEEDYDGDVDIVTEEIQQFPANKVLLRELLSTIDDKDESWIVEEQESGESDIDFPESPKISTDDKSYQNIHENKSEVLVSKSKCINSKSLVFKTLLSDKNEKSILSSKKTNKYLQDSNTNMYTISELSNISFENNISEINQKPICKEQSEVKSGFNEKNVLSNNMNDNLGSNEAIITSFGSTNLPDLTYSKDLFSPSCSKYLPNPIRSNILPGQSVGKPVDSSLSHSPGSFNNDSNSINLSIEKEQETELLFNFYNKLYLNDSFIPMEITEDNIDDVEVLPINQCNFINTLSKNMRLENSYEDSQLENANDFVEDPDIVNPDILYNIDLNEHHKQMEILVEKITNTPDDITVLNECVQLIPIPQIEHEKKKFTADERLNFMNGITEWEYDIDSDDWNKIMVKRAVIFTAHAGFSIANEESLYVLADVAIDYIKKLAVIMKKNFDIQLQSSCPDSIDPIKNSLLEIGVKGGLLELIKHYENDVFGRRDKLMKKCQHLQKIIDQYIERTLLNASKIEKQFISEQEVVEDNSANEKVVKNEKSKLSPQDITETEPITEEVKIETQTTIEEVKIETPLTSEKIKIETQLSSDVLLKNTENEQTEIISVNNKVIDIHTDSSLKNIENIKSETHDISDRKINNTKITDTNTVDIDLLKPLVVESTNTNKTEESSSKNDLESIMLNLFGIEGFKQFEGNKQKKEWKLFSDRENNSCSKKDQKLYDQSTIKQLLESLHSQEVEEPIKPINRHTLELDQMLKDFDDDFKRYKSSFIENNISSSETIATQTNTSFTQSNLTPIQALLVHTNSYKGEASSSNEDNTTQSIPVTNMNDNCNYNDDLEMVSLPSSSLTDDLLNNS